MKTALLALLFLVGFSASANSDSSYYYSFGDSITAGVMLTVENHYPTLIAKEFSLELQNFAVSGQTSCQMSDTQVFKEVPERPAPKFSTLMIGTNDSNVQGLGTYEAVYERCLKASLTWLSIPKEDKTFANTCQQVGTWTTNSLTPGSLQSTDENARLICEFETEKAPAYFWFMAGDDLDASFTFKIDNQEALTVKTKSPVAIKTKDGRGLRGQVAFRYSGLKAGRHTITFTVNSKNKSPVILYGIGSIKTASQRVPLYVGGVPFQNKNKKAPESGKYNLIAQKLSESLQTEGLPITFVDVRAKLKGEPIEMMDDLHPNIPGNQRLFEAFAEKIKDINL